jgi:hypothetical protein
VRLWLIFIQSADATWLEAAWDDNSTAENHSGWEEEVARCRKLADDNGYKMRIASTVVSGVFGLFDVPELPAEPVEPATHDRARS